MSAATDVRSEPGRAKTAPRIRMNMTKRARWTGIALAAAIVVASILALTTGELAIAPLDLVTAPFRDLDPYVAYTLGSFLGPRIVVGILAGALFGISGTLFQTLTRNPLGSPDVIGVSAGASAGTAVAASLAPGLAAAPFGAAIGAGAAILALLIAVRGRLGSPNRVIIAGIGIAAIGNAVILLMMDSLTREQATTIAAYLAGSLDSRSWGHVLIAGCGVIVLLPLALALSPRLTMIELGDELAEALGANVARTRLWGMLIALAAATAAVAAVGPIAFVALAAPQLVKRIAGTQGASVGLSALMGAALISVADYGIQQLPTVLPIGIATSLIGACYLGFVLTREWRKGTLG